MIKFISLVTAPLPPQLHATDEQLKNDGRMKCVCIHRPNAPDVP